MFIFVYLSFPLYVLFVAVLKSIGNWAHSEVLLAVLVILFSSLIYFGIVQVVGYLLRNIKCCLHRTETQIYLK